LSIRRVEVERRRSPARSRYCRIRAWSNDTPRQPRAEFDFMSRAIAFDLSRLFIGPMTPTPRGIDRVDLAYARHFFEKWAGDCVGTLPTPWGIRWFNRERSLRVVNFIENYWGETENALSDPAYLWVKARLKGEKPTVPLKKKGSSGAYRLLAGFSSFARRHGLALGSPIGSLAHGAIYLNTGQIALAVPTLLRWLARRSDVKPVFMLHDVIPIAFPEYCPAMSVRAHRQMLASTARYAAGLIVTTRAAGDSIGQELGGRQRANLPTLAVPLPVPATFLDPTVPEPDLRDVPYFVVSGVIDPRKNHLMLLHLWRELVRNRGEKSPKLVLVGPRLRTSDAVIDMLERCQIIKDHIVEVGGLSTPGLRQLLAGARALLMPSFAEGFGLPIIEALSVGTPAIASDLASHKEVGGAYAQYVSPIDGLGWLAAIEAHANGDIAQSPHRALARSYRPRTWNSYFQTVEPFLLAR